MNQSTAVTVADEFKSAIDKMAPQLKDSLPAHVSLDKFQRVTMTAVQNNPSLLDAQRTDRRTLFLAVSAAAQTGLMPDGREGAIVTFGNKAQFMPMVAGLLKLVRNSGELASLDAQIVYKNDEFTYRPGIDAVPQHKPDWFGDRGDAIGVYAVARMKDGAAYVEIMNRQQIEQVRNVSRAAKSGPWVTWWDEMARKTAIRRLAKRLPLSTDLDEMLRRDDDLFMPAEESPPTAPTQPEAGQPVEPRARATRLDKVAAAGAGSPPMDDGDGVVIDHDSLTPAEHDSPI